MTTRPALRHRYSSSVNSRCERASVRVARRASWRSRSISRSPVTRRLGSADWRRSAPQQRLQAGEQLGEGERLREVVVTAALQPSDTIIHGSARGEDEHRGAHAPSTALPDEVQAVHARQDDIHDQGVVNPLRDELQSIFGGLGVIHRVARLDQSSPEEVGDPLIVLDQQNTHRCPPGVRAVSDRVGRRGQAKPPCGRPANPPPRRCSKRLALWYRGGARVRRAAAAPPRPRRAPAPPCSRSRRAARRP